MIRGTTYRRVDASCPPLCRPAQGAFTGYMSDTISSADPDPIRHSAPSPGGEVPTPEAPEDPTPPDAPVGDAAGEAAADASGTSDETLPQGYVPEVDGGVIQTDAALGGPDTVIANDALDGGEIEREM